LKNINQILLLLLLISFGALNVNAQSIKQKIVNKNWVLNTSKIELETELNFSIFTDDQVDINTMIWKFLPNGKIENDYKSSDDVEACLGVDFLDIDVNYSSWKVDLKTQKIILTLKGGYASVDDFIMKKEYDFEYIRDENLIEGFKLIESKVLFFKDLTQP
jgi:hypothetical protein